jgi:hypothetical protein
MCDGYSLECRPTVGPHDRPGLARLLRYGMRPAFSPERLTLALAAAMASQNVNREYLAQKASPFHSSPPVATAPH